MSTSIIHGQMSVVDESGNVQVLHQESSASDILVDRTANTQGDNDASVIPSDVDTLQKLSNKLGKLAFKSQIESSDLSFGFVVNDFTVTETGRALDAVAGKNLNDRLTTIEDSELLVIGTEIEDSEDILPVSEINDDVTSLAATWSSSKINDIISSISDHFYISLTEAEDETYTTSTTIDEIEEAYQAGHAIWVTANDLHLPLTQRVDVSTWIFSGYTNGQACDVQITASGVTFSYTEVLTSKKVPGIETVYDSNTDTLTFI